MTEAFLKDRPFLENKYHRTDAPFNPYNRRAYHGYEYDAATGMRDTEIREALLQMRKDLESLPHPVAKARAIRFVLEHTRIDVPAQDWFVGIDTWDREINVVTFDPWRREVFEEKIPEVDECMKLMNESGAVAIWPDFDHVVPDWDSLMRLGFAGIRARAREARAEHERCGALTARQAAFFDGIEEEYSAIIDFVDRLYRYACVQTHPRAARYAECLLHLRDGAPTDIYEAMQFIYLYFMISESVDQYQVRSLGNGLDHTLYPFYQADLASGRYTREEIRELLCYFLMQWAAIGNYWGQPFYLGGSRADGSCRINELSYDILAVYRETGIYNPKVQIKYNDNTPLPFLNEVLDLIRNGQSNFVFCCEKGMMRAVMSYGATHEEALEMDIRGCYETGVRANEVCTGTGYINPLKAVVLTLHNGVDPRTGTQLGPRTGECSDFTDFAAFYAAYLKQLENLISMTLRCANTYERFMEEISPSSMYSATIETSLKNAYDGYAGGVKFNNSAVLLCGLGTAVDALMALQMLVFEHQTVSLSELCSILDADWEGAEHLRLMALDCPHKYGRNDPLADSYAQAIASFFCNRVNGVSNARGGIYKAILHSAMQFVWQGEKTEATPDGRHAGEEISKNGSPTPGADTKGVTALILSALKLSPTSFPESFCLDLMLHPSSTQGERGLAAMKSLLDVYDRGYGMSLQFNVFDVQTLLDAQQHPDRYRNLQVRVCGWNVLWNDLSKCEQDAYIKRCASVC